MYTYGRHKKRNRAMATGRSVGSLADQGQFNVSAEASFFSQKAKKMLDDVQVI